MSESAMAVSANALDAKRAQERAYRKKGLIIALMSGFLYGGYTAFMTQGMGTGIWADWYGGAITGFALTYTLSAIGAATNDICSAVYTLKKPLFHNISLIIYRSSRSSSTISIFLFFNSSIFITFYYYTTV